MTETDPLTADFSLRFPNEFARILGRADVSEISKVLETLPTKAKAAIVARLPRSIIAGLLDSREHLPEQWLVDASFDDAITLLSRIPRERRLAIVNSLGDARRRTRLLRHQQYPAHSVGALVSDVLLRIDAGADAAQVRKELRDTGEDEPGAVVVVDSEGHYVGLLNTWRLLLNDTSAGTIRDFILKVAPIYPETPIANAVQNDKWLKRNWLPVVDHKQRVMGCVSRARLFGAAKENAARQRSAADVLFDLMTELVYVLGALVDRVLVGRRTS